MNVELLEQRRQLEAGFASDNWNSLNFQQRLELCRELEYTFALEHGVTPCYVTAVPMDDGTYGFQSNHTIVLNTHILDDGAFHVILRDENNQPFVDEYGTPIEQIVPIPAANWSVMETIYHEGTHGIQESEGRLASTYIESNCDYALYRLQGCEKEAFSIGHQRTLDAIAAYERSNNVHDFNAELYYNSIKDDTFQSYLDEAVSRYHDPNIEQTLNQFIEDRDNGVVPQNPNESYQAIARNYDNQYGITHQTKESLLTNAKNTAIDHTSHITGSEVHENNFITTSIDLTDDGYGVENGGLCGDYEVHSVDVNDGYGLDDASGHIVHQDDNNLDDGYGVSTENSFNSTSSINGNNVSDGVATE